MPAFPNGKFNMRDIWTRLPERLSQPDDSYRRHLDNLGITDPMASVVEISRYLMDHVMSVAMLLPYGRVLPVGRTIPVLFPGLVTVYPLSEFAALCAKLHAPDVAVLGHHLGLARDDAGAPGRMFDYYSAPSIEEHLEKAGLVNQRFICQPHDYHTGTQADTLVTWAKERGWVEKGYVIALMAAPAHLVSRCYATAAKSFLEANTFLPIVPVPHLINPFNELWPCYSNNPADDDANRFDQLTFHRGELDRIFDMVAKGDVASVDELQQYGSRTVRALLQL